MPVMTPHFMSLFQQESANSSDKLISGWFDALLALKDGWNIGKMTDLLVAKTELLKVKLAGSEGEKVIK